MEKHWNKLVKKKVLVNRATNSGEKCMVVWKFTKAKNIKG
jgi:hypothetical protein